MGNTASRLIQRMRLLSSGDIPDYAFLNDGGIG
jgi:hypothetical protein